MTRMVAIMGDLRDQPEAGVRAAKGRPHRVEQQRLATAAASTAAAAAWVFAPRR
jgi:hypothetical protein